MNIEFDHCHWLHDIYQQLLIKQCGERPSHALLISGVNGVGKELLLQTLIAHDFCKAPLHQKACGQCQYCNWLQQGSHSDLMKLAPDAANKIIKVDAIRSFNEFLYLTPREKFRIGYIKGADSLNINASNALLKTLEEPPGQARVYLSSSMPERLPITIRSRCQIYHVKTPNLQESLAFLSAYVSDQTLAKRLLYFSQGAPLLALERYQSEWHLLYQEIMNHFAQFLKTSEQLKPLLAILVENIESSMDVLMIYLNQLIRLKAGLALILNDCEQEMVHYKEVHQKHSVPFLMAQYDELLMIKARLTTQVRLDWQLESWLLKFS